NMRLGARNMDESRMVLGRGMKLVLISGATGLGAKPRCEAEEEREVMKQVYLVPLLLLVIVPALAQDQNPVSFGRVETRYDRLADTTTVQCDLIELGKGAPRLIIQANASFSGQRSNETAVFWLGLSSFKSGASRRTPLSFHEA